MNAIDGPPYLREVRCEGADINTEEFPFSLPAIRSLLEEPLRFSELVTIFVGENGSGKSTILEALAIGMGLNPEGGSKNFSFNTRSSHSSLHEHLRWVRSLERPRDQFFLRAESYFNLATNIEDLDREAEASGAGELPPPIINSYGGNSLHEQSHGESFLALFRNRFHGRGMYLLDEPEAALSPLRQLVFLRRMYDLERSNSQFIIATHSPILLAYPGAQIFRFSEHGIAAVKYEETDHYLITKRFLENPKRMLDELFE